MPRGYSTSKSGSESTEEEENHSPDRSRSRSRSSSESSHDEGVGSSQVEQHLSKSPSRAGPPSGGRPTGGDRHPSRASPLQGGGQAGCGNEQPRQAIPPPNEGNGDGNRGSSRAGPFSDGEQAEENDEILFVPQRDGKRENGASRASPFSDGEQTEENDEFLVAPQRDGKRKNHSRVGSSGTRGHKKGKDSAPRNLAWRRIKRADLSSPDEDNFAPSRKRRKRQRKESASESSSCSSGSDYEAFRPKARTSERKWHLHGSSKEYAKTYFTEYIGEDDIETVVAKYPKPDHSFLRVEKVDEQLEVGLPKKVGSQEAAALLGRDKLLARCQEKTTRITGPLGKLWQMLNQARKANKDGFDLEVDSKKALKLAEQAIILNGQAVVSIRHTRRLEIATALAGNVSEARKLLNKYDDDLRGEELFGAKFHKHLDRDMVKEAAGLLALKTDNHKKDKRDRSRNRKIQQERQSYGGGPPRDTYGGRNYQRNLPRETQPFRGGPPRNGTDRGGHSSFRGRGRGTKRYVPEFCSSTGHTPGLLLVSRDSSTGGTRPSRSESDRLGQQADSRTRATGTRELGKTNKRPHHPGDGGRLSNKIHEQPTAVAHNPGSKVVAERATPGAHRNRETGAKRRRSGSPKKRNKVSRSHLSPSEERREPKTYIQPKKVEPVGRVRPLQDGGLTHSERPPTGRGLADQARPEGCIFLRPNGEKGSDIPAIPVGGNNLPVSEPSFRPSISTLPVHQADETNSGVSQKARDSHGRLPGRPADHESRQTETLTRREDDLPVAGGPGVCDQQRKISPSPMHISGIPGHDAEHLQNDNEPFTGQSQEGQRPLSQHAGLKSGLDQGTVSTDRDAELYRGSDPASPAALQTAAITPESDFETGCLLRDHDYAATSVQDRAAVVACSPGGGERETHSYPSSGLNNGHRCEPNRLGSNLSGPINQGILERGGESRAHQCSGTPGSVLGDQRLDQQERGPHTDQIRQQDDSGPHQQDGGHQISAPGDDHKTSLGVLLESQAIDHSSVSPGKREHMRRQAIAGTARLQRLETGHRSVLSDIQEMGPMLAGSVCQQMEHPTPPLCQLESRPGSDLSGRFSGQMERGFTVRFSPILLDQSLSCQDVTRQGGVDFNHTNLAHPGVVRNDPRATDRESDPAAPVQRTAAVADGGDAPAAEDREPPLSGLENLRERLRSQGLSEDATNLVSCARRKGTRAAYNSAWAKWSGWCLTRKVDPIHAPVEFVAEFLTDLFNAGYEYSTVNSHRSAISAFHVEVNGAPIGQHPVVKQLVTGVFNERPPHAKVR